MSASTETDPTDSGRAVFWAALLGSSLIALGVVLKELGAFLGRMESADQAFSAGVFTGPATSTADLRAAAGVGGVWSSTAQFATRASEIIRWHITVDMVFAVLFGLTLLALLRAVTTVTGGTRELARNTLAVLRMLAADLLRRQWSMFRRDLDVLERQHLVFLLPALYVVADLAENLVTYFALGCSGTGSCDFRIGVLPASLVHALSDLKWLLVAVNVLMIVILFVSSRSQGAVSLQKSTSSSAGGTTAAAGAPLGVIGVVSLFLVLMALPAGGALDQVPDVLRGQFDSLRTGHDVWPTIASLGGLALFMAVVYLVSQPGTLPTRRTPQQVSTVHVFYGALALSALLLAVHWGFDRTPKGGLPTLAPLVLFVLLWLTSLLVARLRDVLTSAPEPDEPDADAATGYDPTFRARVTVALLVGGILMAGGIAAIRALLPAIVANSKTDWLETGTFGLSLLVASVVSAAAVWLVYEVLRSPDSAEAGRWTRLAARVRDVTRSRLVGALVVLATLVLTATLMVDPDFASAIGVPATLTIALSALCLLVGVVTALTRARVWHVTLALHPGTRTPWMTLLVGVWILSNLLNTTGGYHDARTVDGTATAQNLPEAFQTWASQWGVMDDDCLVSGTVPMVFVAAPGGGGKAAYWTGLGMDALFTKRFDGQPSFCPGSLFAASGVSGGAVGLAARFAVAPTDPTRRDDYGSNASEPVLANMTDDDALAAALGSMILRDLPASLAAVRSGWRDRAAVLEDALAGDEAAFRSADGEDGRKTIDELGAGWWTRGKPILLLNGTSVGDGCRALMTNVRELPDAGAGGCLSDAPRGSLGTISAAVDVLKGLLPSTGASGAARGVSPSDLCEGEQPAQTLRATTASVLAARFPYVTPSGALRTCTRISKSGKDLLRVHSSYVVDGGYLENTGMMSLLQLWEGTEDMVMACNRAAEPGAPKDENCPHAADGTALKIQPWFVLVENHYTSTRAPREASRPHEALVPLTTAAGKRSTTLGTPALVQALTIAANRDYGSGLDCNFFMSLTAAKAPQVEAPLGWVLAPSTRNTMNSSMVSAYADKRRVHACPPPPDN